MSDDGGRCGEVKGLGSTQQQFWTPPSARSPVCSYSDQTLVAGNLQGWSSRGAPADGAIRSGRGR